MLHGHPALLDLEERPVERPVHSALESMAGGFPNALADLDAEDRNHLRGLYFDALEHFAPNRGDTTVVNRSPLSPVDAGLIARVFPDARMIFIMRDPADVCLSCFMQNFRVNHATVQFTSPQRTAVFYDACMRAWTTYLERLPLRVHYLRYEDLVVEPEKHLRALLTFLGEDWHPGVLEHTQTAEDRGRSVRTASYQQVAAPLYRRAAGRWRRYGAHMGAILDVVEPWRQHFGYS